MLLFVIKPCCLLVPVFGPCVNPAAAEVALPTVDKAFALAPGISYLHITGFEQKTTQEVVDAVHKLGDGTLKGLLLDLRDNHGGMVDAAVGVTSLFLRPDLLVLTIRGRSQPEKIQRTVPMSSHLDFPLKSRRRLFVSKNTNPKFSYIPSRSERTRL